MTAGKAKLLGYLAAGLLALYLVKKSNKNADQIILPQGAYYMNGY